MQAKLVVDARAVDSLVLDEKSLGVLSEDRLKILRSLGEAPKYPAQVARELRMQVQTVYYHVRILQQAGMIRFVETEEHGGATAKKFAAAADAFSVVVNAEGFKPFGSAKLSKPPEMFAPFVTNGFLDAKFVLGSPDAHGKYRCRGLELCAMELSMFLGNFATFGYPLYYLDTELKEKVKRGNIIAVGGPKVNTFVAEINHLLPISFDEKTFTIKSSISGKSYEENVGVVETIENPLNKSKSILLVAGTNHISTRVAVLALLNERKKLEKGNRFDSTKNANVVQGFDEDGDGIVDAVEILE